MTPARLKLLGWVLLALKALGTMSAWSALQTAEVRTGYILANTLLLLAGITSLVIGYWRARAHSAQQARDRSE